VDVSAEEDLELVVVEALVHVVPHQVVLLLLPRLVLLQVCGDLVFAQQPGVDCVRAHVHVVFLFHHRCLAAVLQRVHPLPFWVLLQTIPAQELLPFLPDLLVDLLSLLVNQLPHLHTCCLLYSCQSRV